MKPVKLPVTVTVKVPDTVPVQDRVLVPDVVDALRVMLFGESVHVFPVEGEAVAVSETVPAKLFWPLTVTVDMPAVLTVVVTVAGLAATVNVGAAPTL